MFNYSSFVQLKPRHRTSAAALGSAKTTHIAHQVALTSRLSLPLLLTLFVPDVAPAAVSVNFTASVHNLMEE
ncbi:hypothetical protein P2G42_13135 [Klebsiella electrica]|uniref:hypothetical protein n=1 Tax=Klebsiella electrica TaxID=1259973 RepID=UPI002553BA4F|nr:hypothetical protein [Klebsiella electrica]WIO40917.1 hypothetical protein P2G42_13135 [Klebsiella electrica]